MINGGLNPSRGGDAVFVITGREPSVLVALTDELAGRGASAQLLVDPETLYETVRDNDARAIVVVEALPRFVDGGTSAPSSSAPEAAWDEVVRVARSPRRPRIIVCTSRPDSPQLRKLRKSGLQYTLVAAGSLIAAHDLGLLGVGGKTVHLANDLPVPDLGLTSLVELVSNLADACLRDDTAGKTIAVRHTGTRAWPCVVSSFGAKVNVTSKTFANVAALFGRPAVPWVRALTTPTGTAPA
jgi:hypothetical protein